MNEWINKRRQWKSLLVKYVVIISLLEFISFYFAVGLMEFSCGKWRLEVCNRFLTFFFNHLFIFILIVLPLSSFLFLFDSSCLLRLINLKIYRMSCEPYVMLNFLSFFFLGSAFSCYIFTIRPQAISWFDNHRIDVRVEERLPTGKAQRMFRWNVRFPFIHSGTHSFIRMYISCILSFRIGWQ